MCWRERLVAVPPCCASWAAFPRAQLSSPARMHAAATTCRAWQHRLEVAAAKAVGEHQAAADSSFAAASQREQHLLAQLARVQEGSAAKLADLDAQWGLQLALAEERRLKVCALPAQCGGAAGEWGCRCQADTHICIGRL